MIEFDRSQVYPFIPFPHGVSIFGGHFGDEGKGKFVDIFARKFKEEYGCKILSIRGQGSGNAGHSVVVDGKKYHFHYLTSAGLSADIMLLGGGMLIDPIRVLEEMKQLPDDCRCSICIDERATICSNLDRAMDSYREQLREGSGIPIIGTTKSGVGPCVGIRANRDHITFADAKNCKNEEELLKKFKSIPDISAEVLKVIDEEYVHALYEAIMKLNVVNSLTLIQNCRIDGNYAVILEVSQAVGLDPIWGNSGHFTTSTHCTDIGAAADAGLTFYDFPEGSYMVLKAYSSKVGAGPYPTKFKDSDELWDKHIRSIVPETGVTSGRKRDLGYFDGVAVRMAIQRTGCTNLCINCMDVLGTYPEGKVKICFAYQHKVTGKVEYDQPYHMKDYAPLYIEVPCNWGESKDPANMKDFIEAVEYVTAGKVVCIGVGPSDKDYILI